MFAHLNTICLPVVLVSDLLFIVFDLLFCFPLYTALAAERPMFVLAMCSYYLSLFICVPVSF